MRSKMLGLGLLACAATIAAPAHSAVTVTFVEVGGNVIATTSGSIDITGLNPVFTGNFFPILDPDQPFFVSAFGTNATQYNGAISGPTSWGPGGWIQPTDSEGDHFQFFYVECLSCTPPLVEFRLNLPGDYVSGDPLNATTTYGGETFASLGIDPGTYLYSLPNDQITIQVGELQGAVPEPGTWAMMLLGFGAMGWGFKRRRKLALA